MKIKSGELPFCIQTGPTSFAPIIEMAITIVEQSGGQYHVLLIIADGQVILIKKRCSFSNFQLFGYHYCAPIYIAKMHLCIQVTRSVDTDHGQLSPQERRTVDAIVKAR